MRQDLDRLHDILEAIAAIRRYTVCGRERFDGDELVRVWCLRHIEIIGEAASRLSEDLRNNYAIAPWREIMAMRDALIHGYFDIDWEAVWAVVERDIGPLEHSVETILRAASKADHERGGASKIRKTL